MEEEVRQADLYVVSAPSGAGKSTILRQVLSDIDNLTFSVSHTTRNPRQGEIDGRDYFFVSREEFVRMRQNGEFLEWAEVHRNFYGTSKKSVEQQLGDGTDVVLDIDIQGARQVKKEVPDAIFLFIMPPSWEELERRLSGRGTETKASLETRLNNAGQEIMAVEMYDHVVINDDLTAAVNLVKAIVYTYRSKNRRNPDGTPMNLEIMMQSGG